jgi:hypothetical protein
MFELILGLIDEFMRGLRLELIPGFMLLATRELRLLVMRGFKLEATNGFLLEATRGLRPLATRRFIELETNGLIEEATRGFLLEGMITNLSSDA